MRMFTQRVTLLLTLATLLFGAAACVKKCASGKPSNVDYCTCTMHPSVHAEAPGKCPICGMNLVPVMKAGRSEATAETSPQMPGMEGMPGMAGMKPGGETQGAQTHEFVVPVERQQQIGVTYATVQT